MRGVLARADAVRIWVANALQTRDCRGRAVLNGVLEQQAVLDFELFIQP